MTGIISFLSRKKNDSANAARERLQIIVAERRNGSQASYIPQLKRDIMEVLSKYVSVSEDMVDVNFEQSDAEVNILELNVKLPDQA
ncbi:cell division topological specificity factor MinE [Vibrio mediterranei]|uniref:cell division topological specificity factor MinE n=1 Tax=Vibrio mediterranei TaxID=689 RepID=UPI0040681D79